MAEHKACAIEVLPVPLGPTNRNAQDLGFSVNRAMILRGFSKPMKSETLVGRYFSDRETGNGSVLTIAPLERLPRRRHSSLCAPGDTNSSPPFANPLRIQADRSVLRFYISLLSSVSISHSLEPLHAFP